MLRSAGGESGASESWSWSLTTSSSRMESRLSINQTGTPLERHTPDLTITPWTQLMPLKLKLRKEISLDRGAHQTFHLWVKRAARARSDERRVGEKEEKQRG